MKNRKSVKADIIITRNDNKPVTDKDIIEIEDRLNAIIQEDYLLRFHLKDEDE